MPWLSVSAALLAVRAVLWLLGLRPAFDVLERNWQTLDLAVLAADPLGSLWYLHSQAPLFNAVLAVIITIVGPDATHVTLVLYGVWIALTLIGAGLLIAMLRRLGFSQLWAAVSAFLICCTPSVLYYETYAFYAHPSAFLVLCFMHALFVPHRYRALQGFGTLVALAWLWAVFHPVFIALAGYVFGRMILMERRALIGAAVMATILAAVPTLKNAVVFGVPSASTWLPLNLAQTVRIEPEDMRLLCQFSAIIRQLKATDPDAPEALTAGDHPVLTATTKSGGAPNMNSAIVLDRSRQCLPNVVTAAQADPLRYIKKRLQRFLRTHSLRPHQYFHEPGGWERISSLWRVIEWTYPVSGLLNLQLYFCLFRLCWRAVRSGPYRPEMSALLLVLIYFTAVTHLMNGSEQERMRYTIEPIYTILAVWWLGPLCGPARVRDWLYRVVYRVVSVRRRRT